MSMNITFYSVKNTEVVDILYRLLPLRGRFLEIAILRNLKTDRSYLKKVTEIGIDSASVNAGYIHSDVTFILV